jgi:hypothetical protein
MRKTYRSIVILGLVFFQWSLLSAQRTVVPSATLQPYLLPFELPGLDLNFSGAGVAPRAMSGAFMGISGNLATISFNPAGLSGLDRPQTALVYRYNRPGVRNRQFTTIPGGTGFDNSVFEDFDQIDFGAVAAPGKLFGRPVVGAAAYTVFADQFFSDQTDAPGFILIDDTLLQTTNYNFKRKTTGKLAGFNLGAATRVGPLSFGTTFLIYQGGFADTTELTVGTFYVNPNNGQDTGYILPAVDRQRLANKVSYRGSSLIVGAQGEFKNARMGLAVRIPTFRLGETDLFRLKSDMDIGFYDSVFFSGLYQLSESQQNELYLTHTHLELPLSVSAGLAYRFGRSFLADFDYTYTNWGAAELDVRRAFKAPFSNPATLTLGVAPVGLTSTHQLRLGWELELNPGFGQLFLRGGVRNLPIRSLTSLFPVLFDTVFQDSFVRDAQGNAVDTISSVSLRYLSGAEEDRAAAGKFWHHFGASFGAGVHWNQVALDIAYDYSTFRRASRIQNAQLVTVRRQRQHRLFVGFTGYFTRI